MRRDPEFFGDQELDLIYIAKKLKEALKIEQILSSAGVDYAVETDEYLGGVVFRSVLTGAFFYVAKSSAEPVRKLLQENGYRPQ